MKKRFLFVELTLILFAFTVHAQDLKTERVVSLDMLENVKNDIQKNYYDANFHGINLEENYAKTRELIKNAASSNEMTDFITRFCYLFDDSHLYFSPPRKTFSVDYGLNLLLIDSKTFVTKINIESDAYKKGIRVGDQLHSIEDFILDRQEYSVLLRHFFSLQPQPSLNLLIIKPNGNKYKINVQAKIVEASRFLLEKRDRELKIEKYDEAYNSPTFYNKIPGLSIIKMPSFELSEIKVNKMMDKVKENEVLILDLRSNRGGYHDSLVQMVGNFFDREIDAGKTVERKGIKPWLIKPNVKKPFKGKLVVLIDAYTASAAEIFARIVQLEKRGIVVGDQSAGEVMTSIYLPHSFGLKFFVFYGVSVTIADLIMKDGQRLEKVGVLPDEKLVPNPADLINGRDPVLSRAAEILGFKITPEEAGSIFKEDEK